MGNLLSIIIPNKDHGEFLPRQLISIVQQTVKPDEIIVIDDGSELDNSKTIIQDFYDAFKNDFNIKIELNDINKGVVSTINHAADMAEGDYLFFGSADDYLLPHFVERQKEAIVNHQPAIVCSDHNLPHEGPAHGIGGMGYYYIPGHCSSIKREPLFEFNKFIEEFGFKCDWFLLHAIALKYGWYSIKETLSIKTCHPDGYANTEVSDGKYPAIRQAMKDRVTNDPLFDNIKDDMLYLINK